MLSAPSNYKKNFILIVCFLVLISISLIFALFLGFNLARKYVESEFSSLKIEVMEKSFEPYNNLFQYEIPQISYYQGYLDSSSASAYANNILNKYAFVNQITFYDSEISNQQINNGFKYGNLSVGIKKLYRFRKNVNQESQLIFKNNEQDGYTLDKSDDFNKIALRFCHLIEKTDSVKSLASDVIYKTFFNVSNNRITFMGIPRPDDLLVYKELMINKQIKAPLYDQDVLSFELNPFNIPIINTHPELYQFISLRRISYDPVYKQSNLLTTNLNMSGAFADYKLYFASERNFISKEVNNRFFPIAISIIVVYLILSFITFLLFRNLNTNHKLFKLQYDFINNFTHEFKTPVAVIKIAGNNIKSAIELSTYEKNHYGKILDEEADKLNNLMNKLLSFTQLETKSIKIKYEKINLEIFAQNIVDSFQLKYADYEIELEISKIPIFYSDPVFLNSIFQNLMDNAYKYSSPGNKFLTIKIVSMRKNIHFYFSDKGIGIKTNELTNIFKKFYRIQNQYNQQGSVGLGLAFCKELVVFMNGSINVTSKIDKGSIFEIILPQNPL
ncbi:MAG: sensor histidine kinase [Sphingobacteriales bacterium]|nr:MAG: sensor histidine kinase [Sphingobacteriales bacterium]